MDHFIFNICPTANCTITITLRSWYLSRIDSILRSYCMPKSILRHHQYLGASIQYLKLCPLLCFIFYFKQQFFWNSKSKSKFIKKIKEENQRRNFSEELLQGFARFQNILLFDLKTLVNTKRNVDEELSKEIGLPTNF